MYAELSSRLPVNGSAFAFTYATFGELPAWLVGWNLNLRYGISSSGLARGISSYFVGLIGKMGWNMPTWMYKVTIFGIPNCCPLAPIFIMILSAV
jgi:APA family basic amino acid/polyamine antiporter